MSAPMFFANAVLHIPDGFLSIPVALIGIIISVLIIGYALRRTRDTLGERQVPMLGVMAAFIFAAQAINFPVFGGTSGHLLGGALVAIVVGPWPAVLVMTVVVGLQSLLFQDGGLLALGWNALNMAALGVLSAYFVYGLVRRMLGDGRYSLIIAAAAAAWTSVVLSSVSAGLALALSDSGLTAAVPVMAGIHALIGIGEALITVAAVLLIARSRPALVSDAQPAEGIRASFTIAAGLIIALAIAVFSLFSSSSPDGLERVAIDFGFADRAIEPIIEIMPDYSLPGVQSDLGGVLVIVGGLLLALVIALSLGYIIKRSKKADYSLSEEAKSELPTSGD